MARQSHTSRPMRSGRTSSISSKRGAASVFVNSADSNRAFIPIVFFIVLAAIFFLRLVYLQVIVAPTYAAQAQEARTVGFDIEPRRGTIYDRNGTVLAVSVDATTIYANPSEIEDTNEIARALAGVLGGEVSMYEQKLDAPSSTFSYIQRKADVDKADQVKQLDLEGIYFVADSKRTYPNNQIGGQVIGACDIDGKGASGLEYYYDDILCGTMGRYEAERGRDGTPIPGGVHEEIPATEGQDIMISLDLELQASLEESLQVGRKSLNAVSTSSVVMDASSGEIYATASLPFFNPSDRLNVEEGATKLKTVTDTFEPGSVFKTVSALAVLESGTMGPDTELFCPASIEADGYTISDAHERGDASFTLRQIIDQSSNVGIALATENATKGGVSGFQNLYNKINMYNLHEKTGVDYPGEGLANSNICGFLAPFENWSKVAGYNVSFGQGVSVTPLQLTRFYGALINQGVESTPHFLISLPQSGETPEYATEKVIENAAAASQMVDMLKTVVTEGTGKQAAIEDFEVAGKTSTAEIAEEDGSGYREDVYNLAFTGFLANSSSQLVCFVGANEVPGDGVVTPIFKDIMTSAIDRFKISPK